MPLEIKYYKLKKKKNYKKLNKNNFIILTISIYSQLYLNASYF